MAGKMHVGQFDHERRAHSLSLGAKIRPFTHHTALGLGAWVESGTLVGGGAPAVPPYLLQEIG